MNFFSKNTQFIVPDLPFITPGSDVKFSNVTGDSITTLNKQLADKNAELASANAAYAKNEGDIKAIQAYINGQLIPQGNYDEANKQAAKIETVLLPLRASLLSQIEGLKLEVKNLQDAIVAANTLAMSNANMTPEQRAALEKQNADILAAQKRDAENSKTTRILIIAGSLLLILLGTGYVIYRVKYGKSTSAAAA